MKSKSFNRLLILFLLTQIIFSQAGDINGKLKGIITISGAWALYPMAVKWAEEFQKIHPDIKIDIAAGGAGKGMADCLAEVVDIGMVSRDIYPEEIKKGAWWISVTKDAVVPTLSAKNPLLNQILSKGIKKKDLTGIWITGEVKFWNQIVYNNTKYPIHIYTRSDACGAAKTWAKYLGGYQEDLLDLGVYGDPGLAEAVKNDVLGIGYNNINYVYDTRTKKQVDGIRILAIDLNNNGKIDSDEDFYSTRDKIVQAIASGRYPSPPARDLHFVCQGKPRKKNVLEFIKWILTEGQKYIPESGYINLSDDLIRKELEKLR